MSKHSQIKNNVVLHVGQVCVRYISKLGGLRRTLRQKNFPLQGTDAF